jgi:hypothetical protein
MEDEEETQQESQRKRHRSTRPILQDVLNTARVIWSREPGNVRSTQTEDRDFREMFGCGAIVALSVFSMLVTTCYLPEGGSLEHLLWTLMFMKVYAKERTMSVLAGGVDPKTIGNGFGYSFNPLPIWSLLW